MSFAAKIITDSTTETERRLTTFEISFPRIVLAEFNTHRVFSRNSASSRAIPTKKMIDRVVENPYIPTHWGSNKPGMQAGEQVEHVDLAKQAWKLASMEAVTRARQLNELGVHKQTVNRLLEPFLWHTVIVTATEWGNYFNLRCHKDAHPDIQKVALMMRALYESEKPKLLDYDEWHLPYTTDEDQRRVDLPVLKKISIARCARVSYLTHDGRRAMGADVELYDRLLAGGHLSPFEHVARPMNHNAKGGENHLQGNFHGWAQYRKMIPGEADILAN